MEAGLVGVCVLSVIDEHVFIVAIEELMPSCVDRVEQGARNRVFCKDGKTGFMQRTNKFLPRIFVSAIDALYEQWKLTPLHGKLAFSFPLVDSSGHDQQDREQDVTGCAELQNKVIVCCSNDLAGDPWAYRGANAAAK